MGEEGCDGAQQGGPVSGGLKNINAPNAPLDPEPWILDPRFNNLNPVLEGNDGDMGRNPNPQILIRLLQGNDEDRDTVTEFVRENAEKILGTSPPVFAVAGREALKAKLGRSDGSVSEEEASMMWKVMSLGFRAWDLAGDCAGARSRRCACAKACLILGAEPETLKPVEQL